MNPLRIVSMCAAALALAACGGEDFELPAVSTLTIVAPDEASDSVGAQPICSGEDVYRRQVRDEIDLLRDAVQPYVEMYRVMRRTRLARVRSAGGPVTRAHSGPRGSLTATATAEDDGRVTILVTGALRAHGGEERKILEGWVEADNLSGGWRVFNRAGDHVVSIDWSRVAETEFDGTAQWKHEINRSSARYERSGDDASLALTTASGAGVDIRWSVSAKAGSVTHRNSSGDVTARRCWDEALCDAECA